MSLTSGRICFATLVLCGLATLANAQDKDPPFTPSNDEVNRDLDRVLESEFNDPPPRAIPDAPDAPSTDDDDDDRRGVRLRLFAAYWRAQLTDVEISLRKGTSGGDLIRIDDPWDTDIDRLDETDDDEDFEGFSGGIYRITLDIGKHVAISGQFSHVKFTHDHTVGTNGLGSFTFGNTTWSNGDRLTSEIQLYTGDLDLIVRPINVSWVSIDLSFGGRYVNWETTLYQNQGALPSEEERLEALVPAAGIGLTLRPVSALEIFGRVRYGALSYEVDEHYEWDEVDDEWEQVDNLERDSEMIQADIGISLVLAETIGITLGYRYEYFELERITDDKTTYFGGESHGLYAGAILQF